MHLHFHQEHICVLSSLRRTPNIHIFEGAEFHGKSDCRYVLRKSKYPREKIQ
nr:MAG TPA: NAD-dependent protein deacetylase sirtuin-1 [Caudoviricetes sp.]